MAFIKELEHMFKALPVKAFHPQTLRQELEAEVETPELKKDLRTEEHQTRHRLLCCVVVVSGIAFFLKLFSASKQPSAMEAAAASLLEGLSPFIGHLTNDALLKFYRARVALRKSVFKVPLDQLARDLIKCDPFSVKLFCPKAVEKVVKTFGKYRERTVTWSTLLLKKGGGAAPSGQKGRRKKRARPSFTAGGSYRGRGQRPYRGHPGGGNFRQEVPQPYDPPFRGQRARGASGRGRRGRGPSTAPRQ